MPQAITRQNRSWEQKARGRARRWSRAGAISVAVVSLSSICLAQAEDTPSELAQAEDTPSEQRRPVRQLATDDGVIVITNRAEAPRVTEAPPPVTVTRRLRPEAAPARIALPLDPESPKPSGGGWGAWFAAAGALLVGGLAMMLLWIRRRRASVAASLGMHAEDEMLFEPVRDSRPLVVEPQGQAPGSRRQWLSQPPLRRPEQ